MNLPEEHCENCGKAISRRARANVFGERVLCTPCYNKAKNELARREARDNRPATPGQLKFLKDLGFSSVDNFTFDQASSTLDHAPQIRYFAFKIARQEWGLDLTGSDLRPIVHVAFNDSAMRDRIYNTMQQVHDAAYERQSQMDAANVSNPHYEQPFIGDVEPPLNPRDPDYIKVRAGLIALGFGESQVSSLGSPICSVEAVKKQSDTHRSIVPMGFRCTGTSFLTILVHRPEPLVIIQSE